jgi:hypothetical protein
LNSGITAFEKSSREEQMSLLPHVGASRLVEPEAVEVAQRVAEEAEAVQAAAFRLFGIGMTREARHHGDVRIDCVADGNALPLQRLVVVVDPVAGLARIDEGEREGPDPEPGRQVDRLAIGAGDPDGRVRPLHGLGHDVAAGHREVLALVARVRIHDEHVGDLLDGLGPHVVLRVHGDAEALELHARGRLAGSELDPAVRHQVEGGNALGDARRVVVAGRHQHDAVAETDVPRALGAGGQEHLWRRGVGVLLQEVVLDLPGEVDPEPVGQLHLVEGLVEDLLLRPVAPGAGDLVLVEDPELHALPSAVAS